MSSYSSEETRRRYEFDPTEAVERSRASASFIGCPACGADTERYLFHKRGARFVQCRSCEVVYANPPARELCDYFDVPREGSEEDSAHVRRELGVVIHYGSEVFRAHRAGASPRRVVVVGRMADGVDDAVAIQLTREQTLRLVNEADISPITAALEDGADLIILNQLLEACPRASEVVEKITAGLSERAMLVVSYSNTASLAGRLLRRNWRRFFDWKAVYFNTDNLRATFERAGLHQVTQSALITSYTVTRALSIVMPGSPIERLARHLGLERAAIRVPTGMYMSIFEQAQPSEQEELLTVILPAFNEADYVAAVLEQLLDRRFSVPHEVIVVESNSTDGTREIVQSFEGRPGLRIIYEEGPRGKGSAVRQGLAAATGTIVLIQDADFEYDLGDYDMLLEPILQRRTSFVLGSRSLGLDDWKVRRYASSRVKAFLMNLAQLIFAKTFNLLYQERVTDVVTMFKVFRRQCLDGLEFRADGFNFDIELACMLVRNGYSPMEVPVNYVGRGFDEGKKVNFMTGFFTAYPMFFRCRFRRTSSTASRSRVSGS